MSKKAIIIHGWEGNPNNAWFPWLKKELENKGFDVFVPEMPNADEPKIHAWVSKLEEFSERVDANTYLIGHSIGCQAVLRYLEKLPGGTKVKGVILVAPWMSLDEQTLREEGEGVYDIAKPWIETPISFEKVKEHCGDFTLIYSTTDPYANSDDLALLQKKLDARAVNAGDRGHFDDEAGVDKLPEILDIIDEIESGGI